jgi:hypothetical protein
MTTYRGRTAKPTALLWLVVVAADAAFTASSGAGVVVLCCALVAFAAMGFGLRPATVSTRRRRGMAAVSRT